MEERGDRFTAMEEQYAGYTVYDRDGDKIGKVDDLFLDENDQPEYIGVKMGFLGTKSTLIPMDAVHEDQERQGLVVNQEKNVVKDAPAFDDDKEITPEYENEVRSYYGLSAAGSSEQRGSYGGYYSDDDRETHDRGMDRDDGEHRDREHGDREHGDTGEVGTGMREGDTESGEFRGHSAEDEGVNQSHGSDLEDEDELRVQRSEEELTADTREREAGRLNVRKRVRTDREQIQVPTRREEVNVERVSVNDREAAPGEIGEDEVSIPVVEDEVLVDKQAVVKEEIRVRKDVVNEDQVVEEDVRKEEVDIDDQTTTGHGDRDRDATTGRDTDVDDDTRRRDR